MAIKKSKTPQKRKPFWERLLEWILTALKRLLIPALFIWLIGWLWLGGVFAKGSNMAWDGFVNWTANQGLTVDDILIDGRYRTDKGELRNAITTTLNAPVLSVDVDDIQTRIANLDWVKSARVSRFYNGLVHVELTERIPFVIWNRPGLGKAVVDMDGDIIKSARINDFKDLLIVSGVEAPENAALLMRMIIAEPDLAMHIRGAQWIGDRRWDLITVKGVRIHLPENDMGFALSRLAKTQNDQNILDRDLKSIDMRGEDRIIIETPRGASQNLNNISLMNSNTNI